MDDSCREAEKRERSVLKVQPYLIHGAVMVVVLDLNGLNLVDSPGVELKSSGLRMGCSPKYGKTIRLSSVGFGKPTAIGRINLGHPLLLCRVCMSLHITSLSVGALASLFTGI